MWKYFYFTYYFDFRVKLLVNKVDGNAVAMKIIDLKRHPEARANVRKEVLIHKMLNDPYIIRYFGQREDNGIGYIFLEYAPGGELFDRIGNINYFYY